MATGQKQKSKGLHWREFTLVGKDPSDPSGIREIKLPIWYLFTSEGRYRGWAQANADGSWTTAVGRPSVTISNTATTAEEAKQHVLDTLKEWGL